MENVVDTFAGSKMYHKLELAAKEFGSPTKNDNGRTIFPEFGAADIHMDKMRFAVQGKASEFMHTHAAEQLLRDNGWIITALTPRSEQAGLNPDGTQKYREFVLVRLENPSLARKPYEWDEIPELFHVTPSVNVQAILQQGLEPRGPSRPDMHRYPPRVHFARTMEAALRMKGMFEKYDERNGAKRDYTILRVDPAAVEPKYLDPEFHRDGIYTTSHVPASAISRMG